MLDTLAVQISCPKCDAPFARKRSNQKYCSGQCAKAATRNAARGPRTVAASPEMRLRSRRHYSRAMDLAETLYGAPVGERLGIMADIIRAARGHDTELRNILTDPRLLSASPKEELGFFFRRSPQSYRTIAQAANCYCQKFWGKGAQAVVADRCPEPSTGEGENVKAHEPRPRKKAVHVAPEGWDYRAALGATCKGLLWLPLSKRRVARLAARKGKPANIPPHI
jgi:hypothetical protein